MEPQIPIIFLNTASNRYVTNCVFTTTLHRLASVAASRFDKQALCHHSLRVIVPILDRCILQHKRVSSISDGLVPVIIPQLKYPWLPQSPPQQVHVLVMQNVQQHPRAETGITICIDPPKDNQDHGPPSSGSISWGPECVSRSHLCSAQS